VLGVDELADETRLRAEILPIISDRLETLYPDIGNLEWSVEADAEHGTHKLIAVTRRTGVATRTVLDGEFVRAADFARLSSLYASIQAIGPPPYVLSSGPPVEGEAAEQAQPIESVRVLLEKVLERGQKGLSIQRYKGLGEMNPEQLAETTMNPETRTLMQVKIEDVVEANTVFETLMGDDVEPRREFIEANALNVQNLDI
jgi:DNA gyrase subunit B